MIMNGSICSTVVQMQLGLVSQLFFLFEGCLVQTKVTLKSERKRDLALSDACKLGKLVVLSQTIPY